MIQAVVWDIDGTLIDSEPAHQAALMKVSARYGAPIAAADARFVGLAMEDVFAILAPLYPANLSRQAWLDEIVAEYVAGAEGLKPMPGACETVAALARAGVRQACVSNSVRRIVAANLERLGLRPGVGLAFAFAIAREDVVRPKPDPEPYALACRRLGVEPSEALAVEDSDAGAASARGAGLSVLRVDPAGEVFAQVVAQCTPLATPATK